MLDELPILDQDEGENHCRRGDMLLDSDLFVDCGVFIIQLQLEIGR